MKKKTPFNWTLNCQAAFKLLKKVITETLILTHFNSDLEIYVEADISDYVNSEILS